MTILIKVENIEVWGFEHAIRGMRNPMNSWDKSDSHYRFVDSVSDAMLDRYSTASDGNKHCVYCIGDNDLDLMRRLFKAGTEHRKYLRQIFVSMDIVAPMYWWSEYDTYKVGTVANSTSKMHRLTAKPFEMSDFSFDRLIGQNSKEYFDVEYKDDKEIWKTIKGYPDYEISTFGNVLSKRSNKLLKLCVNSSNYKKCVLNGKNLYVHRLVAEAFIPNENHLNEVNHKDGNKWNNNVKNLEWVTKSENSIHAFENNLRNISGYTRYRVAKTAHRFSAYDVEEMFSLYENGMSKKEISEKFHCYDSTVCNILNGKTYKQIQLLPYDVAKITVDHLNELRELYLKTKNKDVWYSIIQLLPESYNQRRTVTMNYENVFSIIKQRTGHKLTEWNEFVEILKTLPYVMEIGGMNEND